MVRAILVLAALAYVGFGVASLLWPDAVVGTVRLEIGNATARTDVRALYGGLEIGFGLFLAWAALDPSRFAAGTVATALAFGAMGGSRAYGMLVDGQIEGVTWFALAIEVTGALLGALAVARVDGP